MVFGSLALILAAASALQLCVVVSPSTNAVFLPEFTARLTSRLSEVQVRRIEVKPWKLIVAEELQSCSLVLDATGDFRAAVELRHECLELQKGLFLLSPSQKIAEKHWLGVHIEPVDHLPYLEGILRYFNWTSLSLLYSPDALGTALRERVNELYSGTVSLITADERDENLNGLIKKVKKTGSSLIVVATAAKIVPKLFTLLKNAKMMREGYGYVVMGDSVWGIEREWLGLLLLKETDCAFADTIFQCDADRTESIINSISAEINIPVENLKAEDFVNFINSSNLSRAIEISAINIRDNMYAAVATFTPAFDFVKSDAIYFPGNQTHLQQQSKSIVEMSFNSGLENPSVPPTTVAGSFYLGQKLALTHVNQRSDILPNHNLVVNEVAHGAVQWNETWATPRILANRDRLGVAYMSGYASAVTLNTLRTFDKFNLSRPVVSSSNSLEVLKNSTMFPWFVRTGISDYYGASIYTNIMPVMGWKKCAVLYGDDLWATGMYNTFLALAEARNLEILNNVTLRRVPGLGSKQQYSDTCRQQLLELFRCNARFVIVFILEPAPQYILELLFDLGARKGDFILSGSWLSSSSVVKGSAVNNMKHGELLEGTVGFTGRAWIGSVGSSVRSAFLTTYNNTDPSPFACYYYDSLLAIAHAIDACEQFSFDYEDPHRLMRVLRETRFVGCSGFVSWLSGENNRAYVDYNIINFVRNETTGTYSLNTVGRYSPTSIQLFNFSIPLKFADGTSIPPSDLRIVFEDCPFEERHRHIFQDGRKLAIGICSIVFFITAILTFLIYKKAWSNTVPNMKRSELSMEDVLFLGTMGVEAVQLASIGPDFRSLNEVLMLIAQMMTVDLSEVITFSKGVFWVALDTVLATVGLWIVLNAFIALRLDERWQRFSCIRLISSISYYLLPMIGSVCFVPIVFILMDVFICEEAVGTQQFGFSQSILFRDCYEHCWRGMHVMYAVLASFSLIVYIPSAILLRPVWQDYQENLHVRANSLSIALKSLMQVALICLNKTAKRWEAIGFGITFVSVVFGFFVCSCRVRAYNYGRASMWYCLSLLGVVVLGIAALLNNTVFPHSGVRLVISVAVSWVVLLGIV